MTEIIRTLSDAHLSKPSVITIGSFDGVHRGHAYLIQTVIERARMQGAASVVVTLNPHPRLVLRPDSPMQLLSTLDERLALLAQQGLDYVIVFPFSLEQSKLRAREFIELVRNHLNMVELVCGPNFALGYKREGTIPVLQDLGAEFGFAVTVVEPQAMGDDTISSTRVRELVAEGNVSLAAQVLGRYPMLRGIVVHGDHRGRELGYPTANLEVPEKKLIPANGIYAVRVRLGNEWHDGAASIGIRPTFGGGKRLVEIYVFDFSRWIYGEQLEVLFIERLRDEEKFDSVPALLDQMARDVERAKDILGRLPVGDPTAQLGAVRENLMRYEEIDHTADWAFRAFGTDLKELFQNAAYALFALEGALDAQSTLTREIHVQGVDREALLVNWLGELLYFQETQRETYQSFEITQMSDTELEATVHGAQTQPITKFIKAVTYHDLKIEQVENGWQATVVVDV